MSFFNTGPTGPTGPAGLINIGPQGPRGPTGPTTFQSPSDVTGATGSPGVTGVTGPPSSGGGNGPTGHQGATGPPSSAQTGPTGASIPPVLQSVFSSDLKAGNQVLASANSNISVLNGRLVIVNCGSLQWTSLGPQPSGALTITMPFNIKAGQTGMGNVGKVSGIFVPAANQTPVIFSSMSNNNNYVTLYYWNNNGVQTPLDGSMINTAAGEVTLSIRYPI